MCYWLHLVKIAGRIWTLDPQAVAYPKEFTHLFVVQDLDAAQLFGNEEDLQKGLGIQGPVVDNETSKLDPDSFFTMIDQAVEKFPNVKLVATTLGRPQPGCKGAATS